MSYNPFIFLKNYEERLQDISSVLNNNLTAQDIMESWSTYLYIAIEPVGWKAIWRISRALCFDYKINFPCTAIVTVEHMNFKELSCLVAVNEVDNDSIILPEKLTDVPLIDLYPVKEQSQSSALAILETASLIDSLRFFYHNLWMPWDLEFDEDISWVDAHLKGRLQLHFAMLELQMPEEVVNTVRTLVAEGRRCLQRMDDLAESEEEGELSPSQLLELTEHHNRLSKLRNDYAVYEKPMLLQAIIERHQGCKDAESVTYMVVSKATTEQLRSFCTLLPEDVKEIRFAPTLHEALVKTSHQGSVYVARGEHPFQYLATLKTGGLISGLESGVVLVGDISGEICPSLDLLKGSLTLSHLTLRMTSSWTIMKVRPDTEIKLQDVHLQGSPVTEGVDVFPGATFSAVDCAFDSCQTALVCYPNSTVTLSNCTFTNNSVAIEVREGCQFSMTNCTVSGSSICGVKVLLSSPLIEENNQTLPTVETINSVSQWSEAGTVCLSNTANVRIVQTATNDNGGSVKFEDKMRDF